MHIQVKEWQNGFIIDEYFEVPLEGECKHSIHNCSCKECAAWIKFKSSTTNDFLYKLSIAIWFNYVIYAITCVRPYCLTTVALFSFQMTAQTTLKTVKACTITTTANWKKKWRERRMLRTPRPSSRRLSPYFRCSSLHSLGVVPGNLRGTWWKRLPREITGGEKWNHIYIDFVHPSVHPKYLSSFFCTCTFLYIKN